MSKKTVVLKDEQEEQVYAVLLAGAVASAHFVTPGSWGDGESFSTIASARADELFHQWQVRRAKKEE